MRVFNRLFVFAIAVAIAGLGFIIAVEAVWIGFGYRVLWFPGNDWLSTLRTTSWSTRSVQVRAAATALAGLALVILEVRPWRKRLVPTHIDDEDTWLLNRRSTERLVHRQLQRQVPTVLSRLAFAFGALRWKLTLRAHAPASTRPVLEAAAGENLIGSGRRRDQRCSCARANATGPNDRPTKSTRRRRIWLRAPCRRRSGATA